MAVAAQIGGASPNFDGLYKELGRLSKRLSFASPREFNDPGQTLQITKPATPTAPPQTFDTYIRAFYGKEGGPITYRLFFKDENNLERMVSDGNQVQAVANGLVMNGVTLATGQGLFINPQNLGRIIHNTTVSATFPPLGGTTTNLGTIKLDAINGLDVGLLNERISTMNLVIEALNKVLIVANGNLDKAVDLRI